MGLRATNRFLHLFSACALIGAGVNLYSSALESRNENSPIVAKVKGISSLKALVEAAEKAAKAEDWDTVSDRVDEAEALVDAWTEEQLKRPEEAALMERIQALEDQLGEDTEGEGEDGLKLTEEIVNLAGADLQAQLEQVTVAEQGAVFDFPIDLNEKVLSWVHLFTHERRGFVEGSLSRATRYLPMARQIFAEEGVPQDLAYLALIESGFKNTARSTASAVGMWQFIRSTGRIYGLYGNAWIEERSDPVKSCRASARYLKQLYESSGDWYLAVAGYNAGPMTLVRANAALGTRNFWDMARSHYLRTETKNYVPELLAAILVGRFPERYGLNVVQLTPYAYEVVEVDKMTSLGVLARFAGTDVEVLKDLNPELLRATTPPGKYQLRVPPGTSGDTSRALARIPSGQRLDFQVYVIRKSDSLAKVAKRFSMSPEDLLATNNLRKAQFRAGRRIQVPPPAPSPIDEQDLVSSTARVGRSLSELPSIPSQRPVEAVTAPVVETVEPKAQPTAEVRTAVRTAPRVAETTSSHLPTHRVKRGETLFSISERYGININDLRKWNKVKRNQIATGQVLRLRKH